MLWWECDELQVYRNDVIREGLCVGSCQYKHLVRTHRSEAATHSSNVLPNARYWGNERAHQQALTLLSEPASEGAWLRGVARELSKALMADFLLF